MGLEYLEQNESCGIRLNGIKQFVSVQKDSDNENISSVNEMLYEINDISIFNFSEEEKEELLNKYLEILHLNITRDKYYKQPKSLITVNEQDVQANAYYIKMTIEEYNDLKIKILEQIKEDKVILTKIDLIENKIKKIYPDYQPEESLRNTFIDNINQTIQEIQNANIGNDEVKIIVYESNGETIRTAIEKNNDKLTIDFCNNSCIKIQNIVMDENIYETNIKIEKNKSDTQSGILITFEEIKDNEINNDIEINYQEILKNKEIIKNTTLEISNNKYKGILNLVNNIKIVEQFENQVTLDVDNVKLDELEEGQVDTIKDILMQNMQEQLSNLNSVVHVQEYEKMLQNLQIINGNYIEIPEETRVTEIERKRFNSQFEFFVSENLTTNDIKELMSVIQDNFNDVKVLLKSGEIVEFDLQFLKNEEDEENYKADISEIVVYIKQNSRNEDKQNDIIEFLENNKNNKYTISLEYDDNGLVNAVKMKIQED